MMRRRRTFDEIVASADAKYNAEMQMMRALGTAPGEFNYADADAQVRKERQKRAVATRKHTLHVMSQRGVSSDSWTAPRNGRLPTGVKKKS